MAAIIYNSRGFQRVFIFKKDFSVMSKTPKVALGYFIVLANSSFVFGMIAYLDA